MRYARAEKHSSLQPGIKNTKKISCTAKSFSPGISAELSGVNDMQLLVVKANPGGES